MHNIFKLKLYYSIYNKKVDIVNVGTLAKTKSKNKNEGDKERQHVVIRYYPDANKCILVFEKISGAITIGSLQNEINKFVSSNCVDSLKGYEINIKSIPDPDFIEELIKAKRISLLKITVDKEKTSIDEDVLFFETDISRREVELIFKPERGISFGIQNVKKYYNTFKNNSKKIKRMVVEGSNKSGKIRLDTEGIKMAKYIKTNLALDGLVDTEDIFKQYCSFILEDFNEYLNDIIIE